jgi:hypothetical protein
MKKLLLAGIAALLLAPVLSVASAHASVVEVYECGATKPSDNDHDPIVKIKIVVATSAGGDIKFYAFDVDHYAASGKIYSRQEQYRGRRYWTNDKADSWSGTSVKNPSLTMVGSIKSDGRYVEKRYRAGKLEATNISACRSVDEESH